MTIRSGAIRLVNGLFERFGVRVIVNRPMRDPVRLLVLKAKAAGVSVIIDIGAHIGQFGDDLRRHGFAGKIVSFEPSSEAHAKLVFAAAHDDRWIVAQRMALGSAQGRSVLNISQNRVSSSLLEIQEIVTSTVSESRYIDKEEVEIGTLDSQLVPEWSGMLAIKIDTQGFELEVLRGATKALARTAVVMLELSLTSLYRSGSSFCEVYTHLESAGFRCISLTEGFSDIVHNEVLQVDAVFVKNDPRDGDRSR